MAVVVYDISDARSFEAVDTWIDYINENNNTAVIFIVGNKTDMSARMITRSQGEDKAKKRSAYFIETSAQSGFNIAQLFKCIIDILVPERPTEIINAQTNVSKIRIQAIDKKESKCSSSC